MSKNKTVKYINAPKSLIDSEQVSKKTKTVEKKYNDGSGPIDIKNIKSILVESDTESNYESDTSKKEKKKIKIKKENNKSIRLSKENEKPANDASLFIDANDVKEQLKYYDMVPEKEVAKLLPGLRVKYVEIMESESDDGTIERQFKLKPGGVIIVNGGDYLVLASGNRKTWSVQMKTKKHIIFLERFEQIRDSYEKRIEQYEKLINQYMNTIKELKNETTKLKKEIKTLKKN